MYRVVGLNSFRSLLGCISNRLKLDFRLLMMMKFPNMAVVIYMSLNDAAFCLTMLCMCNNVVERILYFYFLHAIVSLHLMEIIIIIIICIIKHSASSVLITNAVHNVGIVLRMLNLASQKC